MLDLLHSPFWVLLAKSILALIMFALGGVCIFVLIRARQWQENLILIELDCNDARDLTMLQATVARSQLAEIRERMAKKEEKKAEIEVISSIVKNAMPVLSMLMKRETNLIQWGFAGVKLVRSAYDYFKNKN